MKIGARNALTGTIKHIEPWAATRAAAARTHRLIGGGNGHA